MPLNPLTSSPLLSLWQPQPASSSSLLKFLPPETGKLRTIDRKDFRPPLRELGKFYAGVISPSCFWERLLGWVDRSRALGLLGVASV